MVILAFLLALYRNLKVQIFTSLTKDNYLKFQGKTLGHKMLLGQCGRSPGKELEEQQAVLERLPQRADGKSLLRP